ncbi:sigma-70 family RNA polymerase sigma factor [Streptomyces sp. NPDC050147]|uniref:RNA polymerase sigma factor n=1 Tax=Streptomyces sp. NPDC050147 TaxID=3155513 RepID=UPI00342F7AA7
MNGPHELAEPEDQPMRGRGYEDFIRDHMPEFMRIAVQRLRNLHDADDAVMEAVLQIHAKWPRVEAHANPSALAKRMVHNAAVDFYRKRSRHDARHTTIVDRAIDADTLMEMRGYAPLDDAWAVLAERAPRQAECIRQRYYEGKTNTEIATDLNIAPNSVATNIHLGLKTLHTLMNLTSGDKGDN